RSETEVYFALASQIAGRGKTAVRTFREKLHNETSEGVRKVRLLASLVFIHLLSGELTKADETARRLKDMAIRSDDSHGEAWAFYFLGLIHYQWNNLEKAIHHFTRALEKKYCLDAFTDIDSYAGLIFCYQAMGRPGKAGETMVRMMEYAREAENPFCLPRARSARARLRLLQGERESAGRWLKTTDFSFDEGTMIFWLDVPRVTQCRVLAARESEADLREAAERLREHLTFNQATHNTQRMIDIMLLQTTIFHKRGQTSEALAALERAMTLAWPGGWIRPFADLDPGAAALLKRLPRRGAAGEYLRRVLAAVEAPETAAAPVEPAEPAPRSEPRPWERNQDLDNPLSVRELEILSFLGRGLRNKEIAGELHISP
ncbi:MAG: tetratricopeptide repeat protein, partial [Desulfobacterales bacterium]|nr:tetratricopeptide repeat protein [Desulfobacterales bacterium]